MNERTLLNRTKLILAEGRDACFFLQAACKTYREGEDVQVIDFGGIANLRSFLPMIKNLEKFDEVETIVIARDAEQDAASAIQSIKSSLQNASLPVPPSAFSFQSGGKVKIAFVLFPGTEQKEGTLEDLCLLTVGNDPIMECVDFFVGCVIEKGGPITRNHKHRLHCFLSGKAKYVGLKIGEASKANAWDFEHIALQPFKEIIQSM
jgi:hypothetical protein